MHDKIKACITMMGVFVMKKLLCLALFIPQILFGTTFMPDNDLHKYDSLLGSNITKEQFNQVLNEVDKKWDSLEE